MTSGQAPSTDEITRLLAQCSQDDIVAILQSIEGSRDEPRQSSIGREYSRCHSTVAQKDSGSAGRATPESQLDLDLDDHLNCPHPPSASSPPSFLVPAGGAAFAPMPPVGPAPPGRRPKGAAGAAAAAHIAFEDTEAPKVTMDDLKKMLQEHSAGVMAEVRKLLPTAGGAPGTGPPMAPPAPMFAGMPQMPTGDGTSIDMSTLAQVLAERDEEVKALEARLADLQGDLTIKDKRVSDLNEALDATVREVRHRQLDLEFQQLKLEERVRSNAELEQQQRCLTERVEEASLNARHAALDVEMCVTTPRSMRAQGSLPWTLRSKNRLPMIGLSGEAPR